MHKRHLMTFFVQSELEKKNKQFKRKIIELTEKSKSLEDTIYTVRQESSSESKNERDPFKENYLFLCEKEEMSLKIVDLEKKINDSRIFLGLEQMNRK